MKRKKPISHNNRLVHLVMGKIKHPETVGKAVTILLLSSYATGNDSHLLSKQGSLILQ